MPTNTLAVKFPLELDDTTGSFVVYTLDQLKSVVEQNIKNILLTEPGERLFDNDFGVGMRRYLFLGEAEILNGVSGDQRFPPLKQYIATQLNTYMPYITVENINISAAQNLLNVRFNYYINNSSTAYEFDLTIQDISQ